MKEKNEILLIFFCSIICFLISLLLVDFSMVTKNNILVVLAIPFLLVGMIGGMCSFFMVGGVLDMSIKRLNLKILISLILLNIGFMISHIFILFLIKSFIFGLYYDLFTIALSIIWIHLNLKVFDMFKKGDK